jgi:CRP/FNR family cyclic AMP-dependent transcriptional regulator
LKRGRKASFDPKKFLAKVGEGKTISEFQKAEVVFSQGDAADAVFYIQKGRIKLTVSRLTPNGTGKNNLLPESSFH